MQRHDSYERVKVLAREIRSRFGITTPSVGLRELSRVYKEIGVPIYNWPIAPNLPGDPRLGAVLGAYVIDQHGPAVLVDRYLPRERRIFTLCHELKHHHCDAQDSTQWCATTEGTDLIEITANVFAAEFIFPEPDFCEWMAKLGVDAQQCRPELLILLKHESRTTLSFASLAKHAERLGYAPVGRLQQTPWSTFVREAVASPSYQRLLTAYAAGGRSALARELAVGA